MGVCVRTALITFLVFPLLAVVAISYNCARRKHFATVGNYKNGPL